MAATVFDDGPGPHMHALVIGIGGYKHLWGGAGPLLPGLWQFGDPGQLTSPPRSAEAVAEALQSPDLDWKVRLGTIDLLTSPAPSEDPLEQTTRGAIQAAFDEWWDRCNTNTDNVALFYVAGHGVEGHDQIVLASDFGESKRQPWVQAFDVDETLEALTANQAQTQIFLVDACRRVTIATTEARKPPALGLDTWTLHQLDNCRDYLRLKATGRSREAQGPYGQPSYFASALVAGLAGGAATRNSGRWWITAGKLSEKFRDLMDLAGADPDEQRPFPLVNRSFELAELRVAPQARLKLSCDPDEATPLADLTWRKGTAPAQRRPQRSPEAWMVDIEAGLCWVSATFSGGEYYADPPEQPILVEPPRADEQVTVQ